MEFKILKKYVDSDKWKKVDEKDLIKYCEGRGYWKEGTALKVLKESGLIRTPFATYKIKESK